MSVSISQLSSLTREALEEEKSETGSGWWVTGVPKEPGGFGGCCSTGSCGG